MSLTSPLGLMRHVRKPDLRLEVVPWLNVLLLGWMTTFLGSPFIYSPGFDVRLGLPDQLKLPTAGSGQLNGPAPNAVLTVLIAKGNETFIYEGGIYTLNGLRARLLDPKAKPKPGSVLMLKVASDVNSQTTADLYDISLKAGFAEINYAVQPAEASNGSVGK